MTPEAAQIIQDAFTALRRDVPPLAPPGVERLSVSAIDKFWKCPEQFRRERYAGERAHIRASSLFGRAFHSALAVNFEAKIHTLQDLPLETMRDIAGGSWTEEKEKEIGRTEIVWDRKENDLQQGVINAIVGVGAQPGYMQVLAPTVQPVAVERWLEVPTRYGFPMVAKVDLEEVSGEIIDYKTGAKKRNQKELDGSVQATGYCWLKAEEGNPATGFRWHLAVQTKTGKQSYQELTTSRTKPQTDSFERLLETTARTMRFYWETYGPEGTWPGASEAGWWCSPTGCSFWGTCPWRGGAK